MPLKRYTDQSYWAQLEHRLFEEFYSIVNIIDLFNNLEVYIEIDLLRQNSFLHSDYGVG